MKKFKLLSYLMTILFLSWSCGNDDTMNSSEINEKISSKTELTEEILNEIHLAVDEAFKVDIDNSNKENNKSSESNREGYSTNCSTNSSTMDVNRCPTGYFYTIRNFVNDMNTIQDDYYQQIDALTPASKVQNTGGVITFQNYNAFYEISTVIEEMNDDWENLYSQKMKKIAQEIVYDIDIPDVPGASEAAEEYAWDIIEEEITNVPEEQASRSFECKFNFSSLRQKLMLQEEEWLNKGGYITLGANNPAFSSNYDDVLLTYLTSNLRSPKIRILDQTLNVNTLGFLTSMDGQGDFSFFDFQKLSKLLDLIKQINEIIGGTIKVIGELSDILADCAASTEAKIRNIRGGYSIPKTNKMIGYELAQRGRTFDFNTTQTKIEGKVKAFKKRRNGRTYKKDRQSNVGVQYCAKEWNSCEKKPWPADGGVYTSRVSSGTKKAKLKEYHGYALTINNSGEYLSYTLYHSGIERTTIPLLSNVTTSCNANTNCLKTPCN